MSNVDVNFKAWNLQQKSYTTEEILLTIKKVELTREKGFAAAFFDLDYEAFIVYIVTLNISPNNKIHPSRRA